MQKKSPSVAIPGIGAIPGVVTIPAIAEEEACGATDGFLFHLLDQIGESIALRNHPLLVVLLPALDQVADLSVHVVDALHPGINGRWANGFSQCSERPLQSSTH